MMLVTASLPEGRGYLSQPLNPTATPRCGPAPDPPCSAASWSTPAAIAAASPPLAAPPAPRRKPLLPGP